MHLVFLTQQSINQSDNRSVDNDTALDQQNITPRLTGRKKGRKKERKRKKEKKEGRRDTFFSMRAPPLSLRSAAGREPGHEVCRCRSAKAKLNQIYTTWRYLGLFIR